MQSGAAIDPDITKAEVMYGQVAVVGSRVKHFGQRYTGCATATVEGFLWEGSCIRVRVKQDKPSMLGNTWNCDRTELPPDIEH